MNEARLQYIWTVVMFVKSSLGIYLVSGTLLCCYGDFFPLEKYRLLFLRKATYDCHTSQSASSFLMLVNFQPTECSCKNIIPHQLSPLHHKIVCVILFMYLTTTQNMDQNLKLLRIATF